MRCTGWPPPQIIGDDIHPRAGLVCEGGELFHDVDFGLHDQRGGADPAGMGEDVPDRLSRLE
jgi:hypothetical protein